jgi:DNA replication protein DnaC
MTSSLEQACISFYSSLNSFMSYDYDTGLYLITQKTNIKFDETRSPLYQYILEQEAIELYKLSEIVNKSGGIVFQLNIDCIGAYFKQSKHIKKHVENTYWDDEKTILKYKFEEKCEDGKIIERKKQYIRTETFDFRRDDEFNVIEDNDDFDVLVDKFFKLNASCCILGAAGCGKSTLINKIMSQLKPTEYVSLAPTNKAARLIKKG